MKRLVDEADGDYIERLENHCNAVDKATARYIVRLEHLLDAYRSGTAKPDPPMKGKPRGPKIFANNDAEKAEWAAKTAAMHQPAEAAEAYDLRLRLELAEIRMHLTEAQNAHLRLSLARWEDDQELTETLIAADFVHDREQLITETRRKGGLETGLKTSNKAVMNRKLAEATYAATLVNERGAKPAKAYPEYVKAAKAADLKPWSEKYFIDQVKSASA